MPLRIFFTMALLTLAGISLRASLHWEHTHLALPPPAPRAELVGVFPFQNQGDRPVTLLETQSSCGCTVAELPQRVFQPGEKGEIRVVFKPGDRTGAQRNTITVTTDDPAQPRVRLVLETDIPVPATLRPGILLWRLGSERDWKTARLTLTPGWSVLEPEKPEAAEILLEETETPGELLLRVRPANTDTREQWELPLLFEQKGGGKREIRLFILVR